MTYAEAVAYLCRDPKSVEAEACRALLSRINDLESERDDSIAMRDMTEGEPTFSPAAVRELLEIVRICADNVPPPLLKAARAVRDSEVKS